MGPVLGDGPGASQAEMQVSLASTAQDDIEAIRYRIGEDSPRAAIRMAEQLLLASLSLEELPNRGRPGRTPGTRELVVGSYVIVYRLRSDLVEVVRIRHHAQLR